MSSDSPSPLKIAFASHPRRWRDFHYVYPVISRRSKGLSIGVNLNPDTACNFDCVYCSVDRRNPPKTPALDLATLHTELRAIVAAHAQLFDESEFCHIPAEFRRLNDIAFSGDGEPTAIPEFAEAAQIVAEVRDACSAPDVKIVLITDACYLTRPAVAAALEFLDAHNLEIWGKLDAGTEEYFQAVNRPNVALAHVLANLLAAARRRPIVLQSLFLRLKGAPPAADEIDAYVARVRELRDGGARIRQVQVYTVARQTAEAFATALTAAELDAIAARVRVLGIPAETYP